MMNAVRLGFPACFLGLLLTACLLGPASGPSAATATAPTPAARSAATARLEADAMAIINRVRVRAGCPALRVDSALRLAARRHSALMARRGDLSHRLSGESTLQRRIAAAGYTGATMVGEVIAFGPRTAYDVVRTWVRSTPHRTILTTCRFRHLGAGLAVDGRGRYWWTVDLGRR